MNLLNTLKSNGIWLFVTLLILVNLLIIFVMKDARSNWSIYIVELICVLFYIISQSINGKDETIWFLKSKS